jgi:hypothetical protein
MVTNPNDPISPIYELGIRGLTKREYFAALILAGLTSDHTATIDEGSIEDSVLAADRLIEALNK